MTPDDVAVKRSGYDLVLKIIGTDDTMTVRSWFDAASVSFERIEQIQFADGIVWKSGYNRTGGKGGDTLEIRRKT